MTSVTSSTRNFYKVTAPRTITIVPDTPAKRREYEDEVVRTFYLSNAELKDTIDLLRIVVDLRTAGRRAGHQRHHHQGHAGTAGGRRTNHHRHRQGPARGRDRRRVARGRSEEAARVRPADGVAGFAGHQRRGGREPGGPDAREPAAPHVGRRLPHRRAGAVLPAAEVRHEHPGARQPSAAHGRGDSRRRPSSASACRCRSRCSRPSPPAACRSSR